MSDFNNSGSEPFQNKTNQIDLGEILNNYLGALQQMHDVVIYNNAGDRLLNEDGYDQYSRQIQVMPSQKARLDYSRAKVMASRWQQKQLLNELIRTLSQFLDDIRTLSSLVLWKSQDGHGDIQKHLQDEHREFSKLDFPSKIEFLQQKHSLHSPVSQHVESLDKIRQVFNSGREKVAEGDTKEGKIVVKLRQVQLKTVPQETEQSGKISVTSQVEEITKEFFPGSDLCFSKNETFSVILTGAFFLTSLAHALKEKAQELGVSNSSGN